ncbi:MAG: glycosyltransferase, partial [Candidatus Dadabacteria bacterium]
YTPFILTVLSLNKPHKGVDDLLNIIFSLSQEMEKGNIKWCNFVIAGYGSDKLKEKELSLLIKRRFSNTYFLGSVSQPLLYSLYKSTEALLIPSVAEGFCLPAIEAMAYGTPVICRPVPAILEHLIENNFVAKDMSTEALKECVKRFIQEKITYLRSHSGKKQEVKRTRTINKEFLEKYSPYNHAREVLEVYRKALSQKGGVKEGSAAKESVINS